MQVLKSSGTTGSGTRIRIRGSNSISLSQRAPLLPRRHPPRERRHLQHARHRRLRRMADRRRPVAHQRHRPRRHRVHRDREGPRRRDAVRHPGLQRGRPDHDQARDAPARRAGTSSPRPGAVSDDNTYPLNYYGRDTTANGHRRPSTASAPSSSQLDGRLHPDLGLQTYQPLNNPATRPYKAGLRQQYGANVSGGTDQITYFVSGDVRERGGSVSGCPSSRRTRSARALGDVPDNQLRPNALEKYSLRANIGRQRLDDVRRPGASLGFVTSNTRFVENDNSFLTVNGSGDGERRSTRPRQPRLVLHPGGAVRRAGQAGGQPLHRRLHRQLASARLAHRAGHDRIRHRQPAGRAVLPHRRGGRLPPEPRRVSGSTTGSSISQTSVDLGATAPVPAHAEPQLQDVGRRRSSSATWRPAYWPPVADCRPAPRPSPAREPPRPRTRRSSPARSGMFVEEEIGIKDRIFVTGALRFDDNSAFGQNFDATVYPKASVSWLLSEEPFFNSGFLSTLRLRAAFGVSGQQPGTTDALRFFSPGGRQEGRHARARHHLREPRQPGPQARAVQRARAGPRRRR